jgi:4,5-DOPA dioxygenase extradiol
MTSYTVGASVPDTGGSGVAAPLPEDPPADGANI